MNFSKFVYKFQRKMHNSQPLYEFSCLLFHVKSVTKSFSQKQSLLKMLLVVFMSFDGFVNNNFRADEDICSRFLSPHLSRQIQVYIFISLMNTLNVTFYKYNTNNQFIKFQLMLLFYKSIVFFSQWFSLFFVYFLLFNQIYILDRYLV